jgi:hypothetical protein
MREEEDGGGGEVEEEKGENEVEALLGRWLFLKRGLLRPSDDIRAVWNCVCRGVCMVSRKEY